MLRRYFRALVLLGVVGVVLGVGAAGARAEEVTQGYRTDKTLQNGLIVRLTPGDDSKVEPLGQEKETEMFGVVVSSSESPVSLSDPSAQEVFVAKTGKYAVLVSTQNGQILAGDDIVISSLEGVGMKADGLHRVLVGKAVENFADNADAESRVKVSDGRTVALGRIRVDISVRRNPNFTGDVIAGVPTALSRLAHSVTDKPVTALRIYAGLAVLLVCLIISGGVLYSGIHSGMTSIGRNPLAKKSITKSLISVILIAFIVVSIGLFAVYLILKI